MFETPSLVTKKKLWETSIFLIKTTERGKNQDTNIYVDNATY
jgi:hypothetical protein